MVLWFKPPVVFGVVSFSCEAGPKARLRDEIRGSENRNKESLGSKGEDGGFSLSTRREYYPYRLGTEREKR